MPVLAYAVLVLCHLLWEQIVIAFKECSSLQIAPCFTLCSRQSKILLR
jgi:hypothetical protein